MVAYGQCARGEALLNCKANRSGGRLLRLINMPEHRVAAANVIPM